LRNCLIATLTSITLHKLFPAIRSVLYSSDAISGLVIKLL